MKLKKFVHPLLFLVILSGCGDNPAEEVVSVKKPTITYDRRGSTTKQVRDEIESIKAATIPYYQDDDSSDSQMSVEVQKIVGDYAKAKIVFHDGAKEDAIDYLRKEGGTWKVYDMGTCVDPTNFGFPVEILDVPRQEIKSKDSDSKIRDIRSLEKWVEKNIQCRSDFMGPVQNEEFLATVKHLGVQTKTSPPGDVPVGVWVLPRKINIYGFPSNRISYWGDSGSEFYVHVEAKPSELKIAMGAVKLPKQMADSGYFAVVLIRPLTCEDPHPPVIFIRKSKDNLGSEVGCRTYDY